MLGVIITTINAITKRALSPNHDVQELIRALNDNDFAFIQKAMDFGGSQLLFLIVSCYICLKLLKDVDNLANKFAGGAGFKLSPKMGGLAASAGISSVLNGGKTVLNVAKSGASAIGTASGASGWAKEKKEKMADTFGFNKMKNFYNETKANMGVGANAIVHGGRNNGDTSSTKNQDGGTQS